MRIWFYFNAEIISKMLFLIVCEKLFKTIRQEKKGELKKTESFYSKTIFMFVWNVVYYFSTTWTSTILSSRFYRTPLADPQSWRNFFYIACFTFIQYLCYIFFTRYALLYYFSSYMFFILLHYFFLLSLIKSLTFILRNFLLYFLLHNFVVGVLSIKLKQFLLIVNNETSLIIYFHSVLFNEVFRNEKIHLTGFL